jgi:hypothetical protein
VQRIKTDGLYRAEWAGFEVRLRLRDGLCDVELRRMTGNSIVATMSDPPRRPVTGAIRWAAVWIDSHGGSVFIDGRGRSVADFLVFDACGRN